MKPIRRPSISLAGSSKLRPACLPAHTIYLLVGVQLLVLVLLYLQSVDFRGQALKAFTSAATSARSTAFCASPASLLPTADDNDQSQFHHPLYSRVPADYLWGSVLHPHMLITDEQAQNSKRPVLMAGSRRMSSLAMVSASHASTRPSSSIRICLAVMEISGLMRNGGIGTAYYELGKTLGTAGFNVTILFLQGKRVLHGQPQSAWTKWEQHYAELGMTLVPLPASEHPVYPSWASQVSYKALQYLQTHGDDFDIIHWHDNMGLAYYPLLAKHQGWLLQNTVNIVTLHGPDSWARLMSKQYPTGTDHLEISYFERQTCELADVILSPSQYIVDYLRHRQWELNQPLYVLPNIVQPLDAKAISQVNLTDDAVDDKAIDKGIELVFYGRLEARKGLEVFVNGLEVLAQQDIELMRSKISAVSFLGRSTTQPEHGDMRTWIQHQHVQSRWSALPLNMLTNYNREEAAAYLLSKSHNRIAIIPSLNENSPYTVAECIANQIPFAASRVGGIPELVHADDQDRLFFQPNPASFAQWVGQHVLRSDDVKVRPARPMIEFSELPSRYIDIHHQLIADKAAPTDKRQMDVMRIPADSPLPNDIDVPLISVCITHFNRGPLLLQTVASVLNQTYPRSKIELVVVDDESTDLNAVLFLNQTLEPVLHAHGWKLVRIKHSYLGAARNRCTDMVHGKYILFVDDDDVLKPNYIQKMVSVSQHTGAELLSTLLDEYVSTANPLTSPNLITDRRIYTFTGPSLSLGMLHNCYGSANIFVEKSVLQALGGFTELVNIGSEDFELYQAANIAGRHIELVPDALILARQSTNSMKRTMDTFMSDYRSMLPALASPSLAPLADFFLLARGMQKTLRMESNKKDAIALHSSDQHFSGAQGYHNWFYGFVAQELVAANPELKLGPSQASAFFYENKWLDANCDESYPFINAASQHPYTDRLEGQGIAAVRRYVSPIQQIVTISGRFQYIAECGDGIGLIIKAGQRTLYNQTYTQAVEEEFEEEVTLSVGSQVNIIVMPLDNDACDHVSVDIELTVKPQQPLSLESLRTKHSSTLADFALDFGDAARLHRRGWEAGFYQVPTQDKQVPTLASHLQYERAAATYDESMFAYLLQASDSNLVSNWPFVRARAFHPYIATSYRYLPFSSWTAMEAAEVVVTTTLHMDPKDDCGDGSHVFLYISSELVMNHAVTAGDHFRWKSPPRKVAAGQTVILLVDSLSDHHCDATGVGLRISRA